MTLTITDKLTTHRTSLLLLSIGVIFIHQRLRLSLSFLAILLNIFFKNLNFSLELLQRQLTPFKLSSQLIENLERLPNFVKVSIDNRILLLLLKDFVQCLAIIQDYILPSFYLIMSLPHKIEVWAKFLLIFKINRLKISCVLEHPHHVFSWVQIIFEIFSFNKLLFLLLH